MSLIDQPAAALRAPPDAFSAGYRRYVLGLLLTAYVLSYLDRQILGILVEPIKLEFQLSDTQMGFLGGVAFALFYATLGLPIARLADRASRKWIMTVSVTIWSAMTALTGLAGGFWPLLVLRTGVAVGEAGCNPCAHSLISDYFPPSRRATAMAVYGLGIPLGVMFGLLIGGWVSEFHGWRMAFIVVGVPGILFALLIAATLREPPRAMSESGNRAHQAQQPLSVRQVLAHLWQLRSFRHKLMGSTLIGTAMLAGYMWLPAFLMRSHDFTLLQAGTSLAIINGAVSALGTWMGGVLTDRFARNDVRRYLALPAMTTLLIFPASVCAYLSPTGWLALVFLSVTALFNGFHYGPSASIAQRLAPVRGRALTSAIGLFIANLVGLSVGTQLVGVASDLLMPLAGKESLRYALLAVCVLYVWSAWHFWRASRYVKEDLQSVGDSHC